MYRSPQVRTQEGAKPPLENFSSPQENCVGRILKPLDIVLKNCPLLESSLPLWCPKLVTVRQTFSFPSSLLRHYQMPECFYVNNCGF